MKYKRYFLTSESVTEGHPDKVADLVSDTILDECLKQDKESRVAVETLVSGNKVVVAGEITTNAKINIEDIVRDTLKQVGYDDQKTTMDYRTCEIEQYIKKQSNDIAIGVDKGGAGDQGIIFGFACDETEEYMPYPIYLAHKITKRLAEVRKSGEIDYLKTDGKAQVTIEYVDDFPIRVDSILISTQHLESVDISKMQKELIEKVVLPVIDSDMIDIETKFFINPTGRFIIGGAIGDTGLTGRKIIVDTYGGYARHGGGAFSGKDSSKVDRSASYMARHIAKNIVANGMARRCEIQLSYGIGMEYPISLFIECFGTNRIPEHLIIKAIKGRFDLTPTGIIEYLKLKEPIYSKTTNYGHFGREEFTWENIVQI
ncbi:MAG: methionine adenosyltransferase [Clostridia bacterium]|nr:methionine adenosyltransferase [Clostridia bacterium]